MPAKLRLILVTSCWTLLCAGVGYAQGDAYPTRPIRLVAPFAPGGPVDVGARILAPKLQEALGVRVYVDNVAGGSGNIGTAAVAKAPGDGYTVLVISSTFVVNPSMFKLTYDIDKDLAPVSLVGIGPQVVLVHPSIPATNMKELISLAKANPGKFSYASAGAGSPGYLAGLMLNQAFGIDLQHVPFSRRRSGSDFNRWGTHVAGDYDNRLCGRAHRKRGVARAGNNRGAPVAGPAPYSYAWRAGH